MERIPNKAARTVSPDIDEKRQKERLLIAARLDQALRTAGYSCDVAVRPLRGH